MTIDRRCACSHPDENECYRLRYPAPMDDLQRADYFGQIADLDLRCECVCHDEEHWDDDDE